MAKNKNLSFSSPTRTIARIIVVAVMVAIGITACARPTPSSESSDLTECIKFEDLNLGTTYTNLQKFTSSNVPIEVIDFHNTKNWVTDGPGAMVKDDMPLNEGNNSMFLNNVNLSFNIESSKCISIQYCDVGGNVNLLANTFDGIDQDLTAFNTVDFNGVTAAANITDSQNNCGTIQLRGEFKKYFFHEKSWITFAIGGQELYVDNICPCE